MPNEMRNKNANTQKFCSLFNLNYVSRHQSVWKLIWIEHWEICAQIFMLSSFFFQFVIYNASVISAVIGTTEVDVFGFMSKNCGLKYDSTDDFVLLLHLWILLSKWFFYSIIVNFFGRRIDRWRTLNFSILVPIIRNPRQVLLKCITLF